ncbi:hypothetical protein Scep_018272 [Stephania cephalantha]|uniref:Uncharacterized protein n=1 Tax=Stephania cephalantha TaxID=152367 RepID=A0AAP0IR35_9MAGN
MEYSTRLKDQLSTRWRGCGRDNARDGEGAAIIASHVKYEHVESYYNNQCVEDVEVMALGYVLGKGSGGLGDFAEECGVEVCEDGDGQMNTHISLPLHNKIKHFST